MILLPDDPPAVDSGWSTTSGAPHTVLNSDDGHTSYAACSTSGQEMKLGFADPSVAEGDIDTIDSVRFISSGRANSRSASTRVAIGFVTPSGNSTENAPYPAVSPSSYATVNGTARPYSDGSSAAWTYANLEDLTLKCEQIDAVEVNLSYLALEVTYTAAVAGVADNATFFGANF